MEVHAIGTSEVEEEVKNGWDVVMVAPQVRHRFDSVKNLQKRSLFRVVSFRRSIYATWRTDFIKDCK